MSINDHFEYWNRPKLNVLSERQHEKIYHAALEILDKTGAEVHSEEAISILEEAGADVVGENTVRIPSDLVERALRTCGKRLVLNDRNLNTKMFLEEDNVYFGPGSETPYTIDPYTGERRKSEKKDVVKAAKMVDGLSNMDFVMSFALANDVPQYNADCHHFEAMVKNTTKPIIFTAWDLKGLEAIYEMSVAVAGGEEEFRRNPFILLYDEPVSPLKHSKEAVEKLIYATRKEIPTIYGPAPSRGATAPISYPGAFAQSEAEYLSGLVLSQAVREGSTLAFTNAVSTLDMQHSVFAYGSPTWFVKVIRKESSEYLGGLPVFGGGGTTDSKDIDQQALLEASSSMHYSALAGSHIIHDVGYMESGMTSSLELLTILDELASMIDHSIAGMKIDKEGLAVDEIHEVGPGGNFLTTAHTMDKFKEINWSPELLDRQRYDDWAEDGKTTLRERAREKVLDTLENHQPEKLPEDVSDEITSIVDKYEEIRS